MADLDRLVREHGPMLYGVAWRILGQVQDAEDVVQEAVEVKQRIHITGKEMIRYLGMVAEFNGKTFPDEATIPWKLLGRCSTANAGAGFVSRPPLPFCCRGHFR